LDSGKNAKKTQIEVGLFMEVLCGLLKSKLIVCSEINNEELEGLKENNIYMNYNIHICKNFTR